ncbi:hypothetical protein MKEN_00955100 [Mycena kentingensis (nom. inval.)]|nr:hypothetical protein MKEN_00955100 [Mycena kentingensis (nom. inval.)]
MPRDAYESDTGERDVPTPENFRTKTAVEPTIASSLLPTQRRMNRKLRAIARIVVSHKMPLGEVARICGIGRSTINNAVKPAYLKERYPRDELANDYDYAGEEWKKAFPPVENYLKALESRHFKHKTGSKRRKNDLSSEDGGKPVFLAAPAAATTAPPVSNPSRLEIFLRTSFSDTLALHTPAHVALFQSRGFTIEAFQAIASWSESEMSETVRRLLQQRKGGDGGLDICEVIVLEMGFRKLRTLTTVKTPKSSLHTSTSLPIFLSDVHGFNLFAHVPLFIANGFGLERLRVLATRPDDLYEILSRGLQQGSSLVVPSSAGLSQLEFIALTFAMLVSG